jgi:hypothetical protein
MTFTPGERTYIRRELDGDNYVGPLCGREQANEIGYNIMFGDAVPHHWPRYAFGLMASTCGSITTSAARAALSCISALGSAGF